MKTMLVACATVIACLAMSPVLGADPVPTAKSAQAKAQPKPAVSKPAVTMVAQLSKESSAATREREDNPVTQTVPKNAEQRARLAALDALLAGK